MSELSCLRHVDVYLLLQTALSCRYDQHVSRVQPYRLCVLHGHVCVCMLVPLLHARGGMLVLQPVPWLYAWSFLCACEIYEIGHILFYFIYALVKQLGKVLWFGSGR